MIERIGAVILALRPIAHRLEELGPLPERAIDDLGGPVLVTEIADRLGHLRRRSGEHEIEHLRRDLGLRLDRARDPPDERRRARRVLPREETTLHDRGRDLERIVRAYGPERRQGRRRAPPLRRAQALLQALLDLLLELRDPPGAETARNGDVAPDERLAVGEQPVVRRADVFTDEHAQGVGVSHLRPPRRLARRALEDLRDEPSRRQRARRRDRDPLALELAPAHQRKRERTVRDRVRERQLRDESDARAHVRAAEPLAGRLRHARRDRRERLGVAREHPREHATAELTLLEADRERRCEHVEGHACGLRREPIEIVREARMERRADAFQEDVGMEALERSRPFVEVHARQGGDGLTPEHPSIRSAGVTQLEETRDVEGVVSQRDSEPIVRGSGPRQKRRIWG